MDIDATQVLNLLREVNPKDMPTHDVQEMGRLRKVTILLDENRKVLYEAFRDAGFKVIMPPQGMEDDIIKDQLAEGTYIVTNNSKHFTKDAIVFDYDVIGIEEIKFVDPEKTRKNQTVRKIVNAMSNSNLVNLKGNYFLEIYDNGSYKLHEIR